ncbi:DUF4185 domain-containing protein [Mycolicibacterium goodii]|uniref:DUF4185 domain-containing protein n=1 Tax=Mycolicibacterium goodii TaxID=134601 RepID=UPI001F03C73D|nr:DUF4185 domain-containing protein [Mycolicibacterium goodii]ULN45662.1 DUF4185 domain-containing protein [Mycolicibacterium goodii]
MGSTTSGAAYVGRVGALAVALGIGAALTTGTGVAWADDSDTSTSSSTSTSSGTSGTSGTSGASSPSAGAATDKSRKPGVVTKPRIPTTGKLSESLKQTAKAVEGAINEAHKQARQKAERAREHAEKRARERAEKRAAAEADTETDSKTGATGNLPAEAASKTTPATSKRQTATPVVKVPDAPNVPEAVATVRARSTEVAKEIRSEVNTALSAFSAPTLTLPDLRQMTELVAPRPTAPLLVKAQQPVRVSASRPTITGLVRGLLTAAAGFTPRAASTPVAPTPSPAAWALLAFARREFERAFTPGASTALAAPAITTSAVVNPLPSRLDSVPLGWVTGVSNPSGNWPQTNNTSGFNIWGTDLGIMWDGGEWNGRRFVHTAFGDTFSGPGMSGFWRSNVLLISTDRVLGDGLGLEQTGPAYQFIPASGRNLFGLFGGSEVTVIPTAGVQIDGTQYVNYMSVRSWDTPGRWTTNFSAISVYDPSTDTWVPAPSTIRSAGWFRSSTLYVPGSQNFQQAAYVLQPEDQVGEDGIRYLYAFGTPSGRAGSAYLSRVPEDAVTDLSKYEYWDGNRWVVGNAAVAAPVIGDSTRSTGLFGFVVDWANDPNVLGGYLGGLVGAKTGGNVSELSVQYNEYLGKYVVLYGDGNNDIQMRVADRPEGPWSDPIELASSADYPGLYAPMIHPWSGTGMLADDNGDPDLNNLYWNMSLWGDYNVVLMQTDLSGLKTVQV